MDKKCNIFKNAVCIFHYRFQGDRFHAILRSMNILAENFANWYTKTLYAYTLSQREFVIKSYTTFPFPFVLYLSPFSPFLTLRAWLFYLFIKPGTLENARAMSFLRLAFTENIYTSAQPRKEIILSSITSLALSFSRFVSFSLSFAFAWLLPKFVVFYLYLARICVRSL